MKLIAPSPPFTSNGREIESLIRKALYDFKMIPNQTEPINLAIALSGGKDSLTMLTMLKAISGRGFAPLNLHAIHIGGEFSCGAGISISMLQEFCASMAINFHYAIDNQKLEELECYSCSRSRRSKLFEIAKNLNCKLIAFGHHRDDNAQTFLMNLLHKAEPAGLCPVVPMHRYGITIIRPLIYVAESAIKTFAQHHQFLRISCRCPVGQNSKRKQVDQLLEVLTEAFPNTRSNLSQASLNHGLDKAIHPILDKQL